jgi:hypothetical protein
VNGCESTADPHGEGLCADCLREADADDLANVEGDRLMDEQRDDGGV